MLSRMLSDDSGNFSSMRVAWFSSVMIVMITWMILCLVKKEFLNFSVGDATLIGTLFGGKVGQKFFEGKSQVGKLREERKLKEFSCDDKVPESGR